MCESPDSPVPRRRRLIQPPRNQWLKKGPSPDPNLSACCGKEIVKEDGRTRCGGCRREAVPGPVKKY